MKEEVRMSQKIEVVTIYKTSAGLFESVHDAMEKKNRPKKEPMDRFGPLVRETPVACFALKVWPLEGMTGMGVGNPEYFLLSSVKVK